MKKSTTLEDLLEEKESIFEKFHNDTKIKKLAPLPESSERTDEKKWEQVYYKAYGRLEEVPLPKPGMITQRLGTVLRNRYSKRDFTGKALNLAQLSKILYFSAGLKNDKEEKLKDLRFYPSAGARFPLEIYPLVTNVKTLNKGLYHYYVRNNSLEKLESLNSTDYSRYFNQKWTTKAAVIILVTAVFNRTTVKYGNRGYRHILTEAGHLGQNIYLCASALGLSCCAIGGYADDELNRLLDVDGKEESMVYALAVG